MKTKTAIVVFADASKSEARSKKLLPELNEHANVELLRFMTNQTCLVAQASGFPVLLVNGALQAGKTFGERIRSAFQYAFNQGYENIVLIGNDCIGLATEDLREAAQLVENNQVVLGPDLRGGTWVIGMNKATFDQTDLTLFNWQRNSLYTELSTHFGAGQVTALSVRKDVNTTRDFRFYKQLLTSDYTLNSTQQYLVHFLKTLHSSDHYLASETVLKEALFVQKRHMRAPPQWQAA